MEEFEQEIKRKTKRLQPILIGPLWHGSDDANDATIKEHPLYARWVTHLEPMEALLCLGNPSFVFTSFKPAPPSGPSPSSRGDGERDDAENADDEGDTTVVSGWKKKRGAKRVDFPEEALGRLVKFLHKKPGSKNLASEFGELWVREAALNHLPIVRIYAIYSRTTMNLCSFI